MAAHAHRESSRLHARVAVTALASIAVALVSSIGGPAVAVPPSVPSVNYQIGTGAHTSGWDFGVTGPSSRSYPLTATTTTISITLPFDRVEILDCVLRDPDLGVIASSSSTRDSAGPNTATIAVPAGRVDRAVGTAYTVTCLDGYVDVWRVTYLLTLQSGVVPVVALTPDPSKSTSYAERGAFGPTYFGTTGYSGGGQTVAPGARVRLYAPPGTFAIPGSITKSTVTVYFTSLGRTIGTGDIVAKADGSVLGFTLATGLRDSNVRFDVKTVITRDATPASPKVNTVVRWSDFAFYDNPAFIPLESK